MRNTLSKTMVAGLAALSLTACVFTTTEPANAAFRFGGGGFHSGFHSGFHGGGFGWRGGGWRGGGWRGGGWRGGGWRGGGWRGGGWRGGGWGGGWWAPAVIGGLAAGALLAAPTTRMAMVPTADMAMVRTAGMAMVLATAPTTGMAIEGAAMAPDV
jgi:hypothetical protein